MANVTELDFKGKKILQTVFPKGSDIPSIVGVLAETKVLLGNYKAGTVLSVMVFDNIEVTDAFINLFEQVAKNNLSIVKATAFVGFSAVQKGLFNAMISLSGIKAHLCDTVDAAKEWLAEAADADDGLLGF